MKLKRFGGLGLGLIVLAFGFCCSDLAYATPSTTFWTPCTTDVQPYGVWHITYDSYFTIGRKGDKAGDFPTDVGLTVGVLPYEKLNLEIGYDLLEPSEDPLFFNAKFGTPEGSLFEDSPAFNLGIFNVGTKKGSTDFDIWHFLAGKTLPSNLGRLFGGFYLGSTNTLKATSTNGDGDNKGFMIAYDKGFCPVKDDKGEFNRFVFVADYAGGENAIGGGGVGLYVFFVRDISLLMGPVWFNDKDLNGDMKWTIQLDINFKF
jgi:hypothetical protein